MRAKEAAHPNGSVQQLPERGEGASGGARAAASGEQGFGSSVAARGVFADDTGREGQRRGLGDHGPKLDHTGLIPADVELGLGELALPLRALGGDRDGQVDETLLRVDRHERRLIAALAATLGGELDADLGFDAIMATGEPEVTRQGHQLTFDDRRERFTRPSVFGANGSLEARSRNVLNHHAHGSPMDLTTRPTSPATRRRQAEPERAMLRAMPASMLPLLLLMSGCNLLNTERREAASYAAQLDPLLQENSLLADQVLGTAASVYNGTARPPEVKEKWSQDIVPLARHLADQAAVLRPPDAWLASHEELVGTWTERQAAYVDIEEAMIKGDRELWESARKASDDAKLREEKWFQTTNARLSSFRLSIDQFP